jgi:hypothetical protein
MYVSGGNPTITSCTFTGNLAYSDNFCSGGGMTVAGGSLTLTSCTFTGNRANGSVGWGGGMYVGGSSLTITNCAFIGNSAGPDVGGGMYVEGSPTITNCIFTRNSAGAGGGMYVSGSPTLTNCTFTGNGTFVGGGGGGMYVEGGSPTIANCILWGDSDELVVQGGGSVQVTYSDVQGGWTGTGNIDADPLFRNLATGDLHLQAGSPAINAGSNALLPPDTADLDHDGDTSEPLPRDLDDNPRIWDNTVDMGAYEALLPPGGSTLSGLLTLQGIVPTAASQSITFTFRPDDGSGDFSLHIAIGPDGAFALGGLPQKSFTLHIKVSKYLAANVSVDLTSGSVSGVTATLLPGDINNDNKVTILDLGLLADAFNTTPSSPKWNVLADLNGDGKVTIQDLGLLADSFGKQGDP